MSISSRRSMPAASRGFILCFRLNPVQLGKLGYKIYKIIVENARDTGIEQI